MQQRRDTAAGWTSANPTLLSGEFGVETDTNKVKIGDGSTAWNSLAYIPGFSVSAYPIATADIANDAVTSAKLATGSVGADAISNGSITNVEISASAEIAVSKLQDGTARQLLQTDAAGTGVEWASNIDVPGTLDVTSAATFDNNVTIEGDLTVNGTTTTIDTQTLLVEDKNIEMGVVTTPSDATADGGGITLKGTTDKTINWIDATDAWTFSEHVNIASGKEYRIAGTSVLTADTLGSGVVNSSLTSVGTITSGVWNGTAIAGTKISAAFGDQDLTVDTDRLFVDVSTDRVGINCTPEVTLDINATDAVALPHGTEAQRPADGGTPANLTGYIRFNTDTSQFEGHNGTAWSSVGGGAQGGGSDQVFFENDQTVNDDYEISANKNAMSAGPITIDAGATVTIPSGSRWVIV
jgi:hypothetical protein